MPLLGSRENHGKLNVEEVCISTSSTLSLFRKTNSLVLKSIVIGVFLVSFLFIGNNIDINFVSVLILLLLYWFLHIFLFSFQKTFLIVIGVDLVPVMFLGNDIDTSFIGIQTY